MTAILTSTGKAVQKVLYGSVAGDSLRRSRQKRSQTNRRRRIGLQRTTAADDARKGLVGAGCVNECAAVGNIACIVTTTQRPCAADGERTGTDGGVARLGIGAAQHQNARTALG